MALAARTMVSGMAWITALGNDPNAVWQQLLACKSGLQPVAFSGRLRNALAAPTPSALPPRERMVEMTVRTVRAALASAGREPSDPDVQLILGTSLGAFLDDAVSRESMSGWAVAAARELGAVRRPIVVSTACSSGSDALLLGGELIRAGAAKCCVCGGADVLTGSKRLAHSALGTMSPTTLRAFDTRHDGTLLGEAAAFLVLEPESNRRDPLAIFRGGGAANDASGMTAADATGLSAGYAIERALASSDVEARDIGVIAAHGSGTPMNDATEANAFDKVFAARAEPIVFGTKGNFGHTLGATGAVAAMTLVMALRDRMVPPVFGLENPMAGFSFRLPISQAMPHRSGIGLSLTLGFGGFDTSLIFEAAA